MAINISGILKSPQGSAIQNAEIIFEQTRTSTEVLAGTKFSVITNQTGNYSSSLGVGIYVFKVRFQDETQYRTVASNVIVTQSMNNYSLNQIIQDQSQLQDVDYDLLQDVIQARDQAAASAQSAQSSQTTATTKAGEASSSAQAALASKNAAQTSEANALSSKNAAQTSQTNAANSQTAAATSQTTATTKATEASNSAQAALTSKNAAQTSEANALASKNAAQASQTTASTKASEAAASQTTASTKAGEASASQTQAQQSQSDAGAAASQADSSAQQAQQSQASASTSQTTATTKASEASSSAQAALASKNAAQTSETNALSSKNQAQTSQTNAANSQTAAAGSQTTATTKAGEASTSQTNAAASQTTATTKAGEASTSQTNAAASQTTATTKAGEASSSQTAAASSQSTATTKATEATNSATLAQKWAANPENSVVSGGLYSALHYAAKAAQSAQTASGQLVWRGGWSAQAGTAPPAPTGTTQDFYRITQAGTILSVQYEIGDYIHWDNINSIWFKMDGTDSVTSVNGRTGAVVVTKTDVGLSAVNNWGASSQTNDASTTTYATTAGVKAAYDLAATKLTATSNAVSATKLVTPRTINGTNFDGTANITTQNWGTSRNLTIGETAKAVNGSADVSWTLAEIGAISTTLLPTGSNYQDVVGKLLRVGSDGVQEVGRILDFHAENSTLDNDVRFTVTNTIGTTSRGDLDISANTVKVRGNEVYHQGNTSPGALGAVPDTRTVNGKRLNADITVTSEDVGTYTKQVIDEQSLKTVTIQAPQGVVAGKYYPIVVSNYGSDHSLFVETRSSGGADPMNYCSFDGQIHNGGWSDTGAYVYGQFTIYSSGERQIHSILGSSEAATAYAIYVEARAFPVNVRVRASANVACTGLDMSYGTTVFAQAVTNPQGGVGTKTRLLAEFQPGNHFYSSNTMVCRAGVETQSTVVVNKDRTDVGSLALGGNVQGYAEIAGKAAGQAGYNYDEGLRYYNDNTWRIGSKKILHDGGGTLLGQLSTTFNSAAPITLERGQQVGIGYKYSATQTQYLGVDAAGQLRFGANLDHSTNGYVYTTDRKPTATDVGALSTSGGTLNKGSTINDYGGGSLNLMGKQHGFIGGPVSGYVTSNAFFDGTWKKHDNTMPSANLEVYQNNLEFRTSAAGESDPNTNRYKVYHQGFKPTAADVGALVQGAYASDLNNLAVSGQYLLRQEVTNKPAGASGMGDQVIHQQWDANAGYQIYTEFIESRGGKMWTRNKSGGVWGVWKQVYDSVNRPSPADIGALQAGATAVAATKLATACTIGGVAFDGTANINLPGVNTAGNQSTTGNAATATKLATARTIAGVAFDGTANITLTAANVGAIATTGGTATGNITAPDFIQSSAQSTNAASCTRKDYVDGLVSGKLGSTTNTVWNATGAGAGQGLAYNSKTAIGGVNDSWLRINPNAEFTSGIYCGASLLRTDGSFSISDYSPTRRSIRLAPGAGGTWAGDKIAYIDLGGAPTTGSTATHLLRYKDTAGATIFTLETLDQSGQTYIRAGTGNYLFNTNGEFNASGNGNFNDVYIRSDKRLKSNLIKLGSALDKVGQLQAYSYDKHKSLTDRTVIAREVGLVAQDVMVVIPEAVKAVSHQISGTTTEEVLTISNSAINAVLVEALKELAEKVATLETRLKEVENVGT